MKEFKTRIHSLNSKFFSKIADRSVRKSIKIKNKTNDDSVFLIQFNSKDGEDAFTKLEQDVNTVILNTNENDKSVKVYISIHSPGGSVTAYANAAQQIHRLREHGLEVIGFVDEIAASGGYMMASVCNTIVAQPFAFVGSIGVVSQVPIVEDLLSKIGIDVRVYTAGENKRSVVPTKKPSSDDEEVFKQKLVEIHNAFKNHVLKYRKDVDVDKLMEGDFYLAQDVLSQNLVDVIGDSNSYLLRDFKNGLTIYEVKTTFKKKGGKLSQIFGVDAIIESFIDKVSTKIAASTTFDKFIR